MVYDDDNLMDISMFDDEDKSSLMHEYIRAIVVLIIELTAMVTIAWLLLSPTN